MKANLIQFDKLPNTALVAIKTFSVVMDAGESTIWRRAKAEADFPKPIRLGAKCTRWNVGDIRAYIAKSSVTAPKANQHIANLAERKKQRGTVAAFAAAGA